MFAHMPEHARNPPDRDDHRADAGTADPDLGAATLQAAPAPRRCRSRRPAGRARWPRRGASAPNSSRARLGRSWPVGRVEDDAVDRLDAPHRGQSAQRGKGADAEHRKDDHRLQAAAADAQQRLAAAARREHHAEAEQGAADERRQRGQLRRGVEAVIGVDPAERGHRIEADHRHADRQHPHAHARPVAHVDDVRQRTHGAEMAALGDHAEDDRQPEGGSQHLGLQRLEFGQGHAEILGRPGAGAGATGHAAPVTGFAGGLTPRPERGARRFAPEGAPAGRPPVAGVSSSRHHFIATSRSRAATAASLFG